MAVQKVASMELKMVAWKVEKRAVQRVDVKVERKVAKTAVKMVDEKVA